MGFEQDFKKTDHYGDKGRLFHYNELEQYYDLGIENNKKEQLLKLQELRNFIEVNDDSFAICNKLDKLFPNLLDIDGFDGGK